MAASPAALSRPGENWVEGHYSPIIEDQMEKNMGNEMNIEIILGLYRDYIGVSIDYIGIVQHRMEAAIVYWGYNGAI